MDQKEKEISPIVWQQMGNADTVTLEEMGQNRVDPTDVNSDESPSRVTQRGVVYDGPFSYF